MNKLIRTAEATDAKDVILGEEYTDSITGIKGKAIAVYLYLSGCDQVSLSYVKDGDVKYHTVDASCLREIRLSKETKPSKEFRKGGPNKGVGARY